MYSFKAAGHENIKATQRNTLEVTKDKSITKRGDCIIAVDADFELNRLRDFLERQIIKITISANNMKEIITAIPNPQFSGNREMVIRITDFKSERTFATRADKSAAQLGRRFVEELKKKETIVNVTIE